MDVADDPDDSHPVLAMTVHARVADALTDRVDSGPELRGSRLVHDDDMRRAGSIALLEQAAAAQGNRHRAEVIPSDDAITRAALGLTTRDLEATIDVPRVE